MVIFHSYVSLPEGIYNYLVSTIFTKEIAQFSPRIALTTWGLAAAEPRMCLGQGAKMICTS